VKTLGRVKGVVDHQTPNMPDFMANNKKRKVMRQNYNRKVYYENSLLLKKLNEINHRRGPLNGEKLREANFAHNTKSKCFKINDKFSLNNGWTKTRADDELRHENEVLLYRLTSAKSYYPTKRIIESSDKNRYIREKMSENARRIRPSSSMTGSAMSRLPSAGRISTARSRRTTAGGTDNDGGYNPSYEIMRSNPTMKRTADNKIKPVENMDSVDGWEYRKE